MDRLITVQNVADLSGWSPLTVYKKAAAGEIPGRVTIGKRSLRFKQSAILAWLFGPMAEDPSTNPVVDSHDVKA